VGDLADSASTWTDPDLDFLPEPQRALLSAVNETHCELPGGLLQAGFESHAERAPDHPARDREDGSLSYRELDLLAKGLAHELREAGARRGELVAVALPKGWQQAVAVLGILESGAGLPAGRSRPPGRRAKAAFGARGGPTDGDAVGVCRVACPTQRREMPDGGTHRSREEAPPVVPNATP